MAGYVEKGVIRLHEKVGHDIWRMQIELPQTAKSALPGQFIHIKINDPSKLLRRPISIAGIEPGKGLVEIIYRIVGNGTEAMAHMKIGDVVDSLGPLGTSFSMDKGHAWRVFAIKLTAGITKSVLTDRYSMHRRFAYEY